MHSRREGAKASRWVVPMIVTPGAGLQLPVLCVVALTFKLSQV